MQNKKNKGFSIAEIIIAFAVIIIIVAVSIIAGIVIHKKWVEKEEEIPRITSYQVTERLEGVSELTTQKIIYQGYIHYEEGSIPFIDKKSYSMTYTAEIEAGVDISDIEVTDAGDRIIVEIPDSTVQSVYVDPDSIQFHDESFAIFNWDSKEDGVEAVKNAENDAKENADIQTLKDEADKHAKELIEELFQDAIADQQLEVR
ncbi:Protein of unknown function [Lachnospiraceae bacterium NE2001]|nr:Protein of unknown function [Lachnospiraceae bacterium NE2001]